MNDFQRIFFSYHAVSLLVVGLSRYLRIAIIIVESSITRLKGSSNVHRRVLKFAIDSVIRCLELVPCEPVEYSLYLEVIVISTC